MAVVVVQGLHHLSAVLARNRQPVAAISYEAQATFRVRDKVAWLLLMTKEDVVLLGVVQVDGADLPAQVIGLDILLAGDV